jgi:putative peptide zinc metalloprotease protein
MVARHGHSGGGRDDFDRAASLLVTLEHDEPMQSSGDERASNGAQSGTGGEALPPNTRALHPSAAEFTDERMLRPRASPPRGGLRRFVYRISGGRLKMRPGPAELRELELLARVKTPVSGSRRIVVISRKGGVGKTTTTLMLGHTFAAHRGDRVVALDGNPDAGSLGYRIRRETTATVTDLLRDSVIIDRYSDIRAYTSQAPTRMEVVASDDNPRITDALGEDDYRAVVDLLERHYNLILLDTGTGILDSATRGFLKFADQVVLVAPPNLDGARASSLTFDWLDEHGYGYLVKGAVTVINACTPRGLVEIDNIDEHFRRRCRAVVRIPWDGLLEAGAETGLQDLRRATRGAYLELAAAVADGFGPRWWMAPLVQG